MSVIVLQNFKLIIHLSPSFWLYVKVKQTPPFPSECLFARWIVWASKYILQYHRIFPSWIFFYITEEQNYSSFFTIPCASTNPRTWKQSDPKSVCLAHLSPLWFGNTTLAYAKISFLLSNTTAHAVVLIFSLW